MNTAVVCLGANTTDALPRIGQALVFLQGCATVNADSGCYPTEPEYEAAANPYQNRVLVLATDIGYEELYSRSKEFERAVRAELPAGSAGLVNTDIDIVVWNGEVKKPLDYASRYFSLGMSLISHKAEYERSQQCCEEAVHNKSER